MPNLEYQYFQNNFNVSRVYSVSIQQALNSFTGSKISINSEQDNKFQKIKEKNMKTFHQNIVKIHDNKNLRIIQLTLASMQ